ncbi:MULTISPECIES: hypothetical protein [Neisseria]|uniref:Periplasmic protein n=2 Tax=Neisseria TaxID=482 RepID=A0AB38DNC7_9NEIS|nr:MULTISPECIES: hypothetical protein [Neisseria]OSI09618.1 hypothetical protein BWD10_08400 [Neisseria zoodegmatis]OSI35512.1 hypothetical protein BV913_04725 [Neisseria dumasiana]UOO84293.1 hypothetical protein LVJ88_11665 [Neisseria dumasiana]SNU78888.1 Periplasmic protein [Neisseria zoodegmatis]
MMNRYVKIALLSVALIVAFVAGMHFQAYLYEDLCLDMGGGRNPGNAPICVIDSDTYKERYGDR